MAYLPRTLDTPFLVRVIKNEITPAEREFFEAWLAESEAHKADFAATVHLWSLMGEAVPPPVPDPEAQWAALAARVGAVPALEPFAAPVRPHPGPRRGPGRLRTLLGLLARPSFAYTAGIVALLALSLLVMRLLPSLARRVPPPVAEAPAARTVHTAAKGERLTVVLRDGSTVHLNGNSRLTVPDFPAGGSRDVELDGEAYFVVRSDPAHPFRVHTGETTAEVRGTEFNVRYRGNALSVVVSRGRVSLYNARLQRGVDLGKGELASYTEHTGFSAPVRVDPRRYTAWRERRLSFVKASLREVMEEIANMYGVEVEFKTTAAGSRSLTGSFEHEPLDQILSSIAVALDAKIVRHDSTVTVY